MALSTRSTSTVIERFNQAFQQHDPSLLPELIASDCVLEAIGPAPDGVRHVGRDACLALWQAQAADRAGSFELEEVVVLAQTALIFWRYSHAGTARRGINVMRVRDGLIVQGQGYAKA